MKPNSLFKGKYTKKTLFVIAPVILCAIIVCVLAVSLNDRNVQTEKVADSESPGIMSSERGDEEDMDKLYERINFENAPSTRTPLSEENLNKMDSAINDLDNRVIETHDELKHDLGDLQYSNVDIPTPTITNGKYITAWAGSEGEESTSDDSSVTDYVEVVELSKVEVDNCYLVGNRSICGYDKNKAFVSVLASNTSETKTVIEIPTRVKYLRITSKTGVIPSVSYKSVVLKDVVAINGQIDEIANHVEEVQMMIDAPTITSGKYITAWTGAEGEESNADDSAVTEFIKVVPNTTVEIIGCFLSGNRSVCCYDKEKKFVSVLASGSKETTVVLNIPGNARYIKITCKIGEVPYISYKSTVVDAEKTTFKNGTLFDNATLKPVITFIDDDTGEAEYVTRMKNLCDTNGIKTSFACLTSRLENDPTLVDLLLSYERQGFPVITHGYQQGIFYRPEAENRNIVLCEDDLVHALQDLHKYGFSDYKIWCTPYGVSDIDIRNLCKKWGFDGLITSGNVRKIENPSELNADSRFRISRNSLDSSADIEMIKGAIDDAVACNGWVIVSTHSSYPAYHSGENDEAFAEIINYARSNGVEIRTVNEELRKRMPIYRYYEQY